MSISVEQTLSMVLFGDGSSIIDNFGNSLVIGNYTVVLVFTYNG